MPNLLVTLEYSDWMWADWATPPHSEAALTASDVTDADTLAYITDEIPKLSIVYGGEKYDVEGTALYVMGTERTGTAYGDETFTNYPFYLVVPSLMGSNFTMHIPTENPGSLTVKLYDYYEEDPLACNWKENIILTPPEEPTGEESEIVTVTVTQNGSTHESDMTLAEIEEAIADGKTLLLKYDASGMGYDDRTYYLNLHIKDAMARFVATDPDMLRVITINRGGANLVTYPIKSPTPLQTTIAVSEWSNNTVTKEVFGVLPNDTIIVSPDPTSAEVYASAGILCTDQPQTNRLVFTCDTVPSSSVTVNIVVI